MAEIEELRTQPQDIQAEQSVLGPSLLMRKLVFVREYISHSVSLSIHRLIF